MILDYSSESQTVYTAFLNLLKYLIDNTAYNIALIPHVTVSTTDDRMVLKNFMKIWIKIVEYTYLMIWIVKS